MNNLKVIIVVLIFFAFAKFDHPNGRLHRVSPLEDLVRSHGVEKSESP
jgi:hypothetical protein